MSERNPRSWNRIVRDLELDLASPPAQGNAANEAAYQPVEYDEFFHVCRDGERTARLTRLAGSMLGRGLSPYGTAQLMLALNQQKNEPPLDNEKVRATVQSLARTHQRNHPAEEDPGTPLFDLRAASVARFLNSEAPARQWVLNDCLPLGKAALLVAPGGTGKSQLLLQLIYDVATGRQRFSPWQPAGAGKVVILSAEDEEEELHRRFARLAREDATSSDGHEVLQLLRENLFIVPRVGEDNLMTREVDGEVIQTAFPERLWQSIKAADNFRLIVLDPLSRFRGGEENAAEDTTRCVEAMEWLAKRTGAAVLAAHHTNKWSSSSGSEPTQAAARGSSALVDGVRLVLHLGYATSTRRSGGERREDQLLELRITKTNYSAIGEPILLRRDSEGRLLPISAEEAETERESQIMRRLMKTIVDETAAGRPCSKSTFASRFGGAEGPFQMGQRALALYIDRAVVAGLLEVEAGKEKLLRVRRSD